MRCIYIQSGNILAAYESAVSSNYAAEKKMIKRTEVTK